MKFINTTYEHFAKELKGRRVVLFGASSSWDYYRRKFPQIEETVLKHTGFLVDNDPQKWGRFFEIGGYRFEIKPVEALKEVRTEDLVILLTVSVVYQSEICRQLEEASDLSDWECYSLPLMTYSIGDIDDSCVADYLKNRQKPVIPKKIHSFWFSGDKKPDLYQKCIESWKHYCPDFEIYEWNADNYDCKKNRYMKEAFERNMWAFVSDFARLDIIYREGGIYLDMDVELLSSLEPFTYAKGFFCRQEDGTLDLGSGFGSSKGSPLIRDLLETYRNRSFLLEDGSADKTPQPEILLEIFQKNGFEITHHSGIAKDYLVLSDNYITTSIADGEAGHAKIGIHWHNGGWLDEKTRNNIKDSGAARKRLIKEFFV